MSHSTPHPGRAVRRQCIAAVVCAVAIAVVALACSSGPEAGDGTPDGDVFVIVIDTLRRDSLLTFEPTSPLGEHFDALASDALVFDDLRSGTSWTRPSVASLFTGQHSKRHGIHGRRDVLPPAGPHLVEQLRDAGYATHAWSANPNILPLWGFERGFDSFVDLGEGLPLEPGRTRVPKVDGRMAFERVIDVVEEADSPGFYYVHVVDPHRPYRPSKEVLAEIDAMGDAIRATFPVDIGTPFTRVVWDNYYRRYMGEVLDVDRALGAFVTRLKELGRYEDATILVVSDHGEEFLEHGGEVHGFTLFEEVLLVPGLLKRAGGRDAGRRFTRPAELADMMPTLLASLGIETPAEVDGRNLLAADAPETGARFADLFLDRTRIAAVYDDHHKLIVDYLTDRSELFDLEADPDERRDLTRSEPERAARMRAMLDAARARHASGWHLRGCGCRDRSETLEFGVTGADTAASLDVEAEDTLTPIESGTTQVRWVLAPDESRAAAGDEARRADRDDLVLGAGDDATLSVLPQGDTPLNMAFGRGPIERRSEAFDLDPELEMARLGASEPVDCHALVRAYSTQDPSAGAFCSPHLRIWYVAPPESKQGELDPEIRDRLRALGYAE